MLLASLIYEFSFHLRMQPSYEKLQRVQNVKKVCPSGAFTLVDDLIALKLPVSFFALFVGKYRSIVRP